MYATCLFCNHALGHNEAIEHFPVGRKLAFDAARGRLWVVCPSCSRWNLTPLESRWEAIEEAERAYRDTKLRASTDNIGLARLKEGSELIRIGKPMLPEFAAWRYKDVFRLRHRKAVLLASAPGLFQVLPMMRHLLPSSFSMMFASVSAVTSCGLIGFYAYQAFDLRKGRTQVRDDDGKRLLITRGDAGFARIVRHPRESEWYLRVSYRPTRPAGAFGKLLGRSVSHQGYATYLDVHGDAAMRALASILPSANHGGAPKKTVSQAVEVIERHGDAVERLRNGEPFPRELVRESKTLGDLHAPTRLALEMILHESDERRALDGELRELEDRWREAEEIASIADNLFLPASIGSELERLRQVGVGDKLTSTDKH